MMRRFVSKAISRVLGAGGYSVMNTVALNEFRQSLAETKSGVSATQHQLSENTVALNELRQSVAEAKSGVSATQHQLSATQHQLNENTAALNELRQRLAETKFALSAMTTALARERHFGDLRTLPLRLDQVATRCIQGASGPLMNEAHGLANHYARLAGFVSRHWVERSELPPDVFSNDDLTLGYAVDSGIYDPSYEVDVDEHRPTLPWRHLFSDPDCGIFLILGQSNAGNHGDAPYAAKRDVFNLDFLRMRCYPASDPLSGSSGTGGSVWSRLGDKLIEKGVFHRVLLMPLAVGGTFITDWIPGGKMHRRSSLALSRLHKELGLPLPFSAVLWQQGEAEANHTDMSAAAYQMHFHDIIADLRTNGVFAPVFVACVTVCEAGSHPYENRAAIREAQLQIPNATDGVFAGPDTDTIGSDGRYDGCHFSEQGLQSCSDLWLDALSAKRNLLIRP